MSSLSPASVSGVIIPRAGILSRVEEALLHVVNAAPDEIEEVKRDIDYLAGAAGADDGSRVLRGPVLRAFCLAQSTPERLGPGGLTLNAVRISDDVNLGFAQIAFPLVFRECTLKGELNLMHSCLPHIRFEGGEVAGINANGVHVKGDVALESATRVAGALQLRNARIDGDLRLTDVKIHCPSGVALSASGLRTRGSVRLTGTGLRVDGCITLCAAEIGANLVCADGQLYRPAQPDEALSSAERECAVNADGASIRGELALTRGIRVTGETRMLRARVRGAAKFDGRFRSPSGADALSLDGIKVGGGMILTEGFRAYGATRLISAEIGKDLNCTGARLIKPLDAEDPDPTNRRREDVLRRIALSAGRMTVRGTVYFDEMVTTGGVRLVGARIGGELRAFRARFRIPASGYADLQERDFGLSVFNARDAHIAAGADFAGCQTNGMLVFQRAHVGADLSIRNMKLTGDRVNGVVLKGAKVRGKFSWEGTPARKRTKLVLSHAAVGRLVHDVESWPRDGRLFLRGFTYHTISIFPRADDHSPRPQGTLAERYGRRERTRWGWRWEDGESRGPEPDYTDWVKLQPTNAFDPHPYEQLGRVLRLHGDDEGWRKVGIAREEDRLAKPGLSKRERFIGWVCGRTLKHGYDSRPLVKATVAMLVLGLVLFGAGSVNGLMAPTDAEVILSRAYIDEGSIPSDYPAFNAMAYSIDTFLPPVIDFHQENHWLPNPHQGGLLIDTRLLDLRWGGVLRGYLWVHIVAGWMATSLLLIYFTGLVRGR